MQYLVELRTTPGGFPVLGFQVLQDLVQIVTNDFKTGTSAPDEPAKVTYCGETRYSQQIIGANQRLLFFMSHKGCSNPLIGSKRIFLG